MTKLITLLMSITFAVTAFSQAPQKMSYQAVVRNTGGSLVTSQSVGMKISILQGSSSGTAVYVENQTATTNVNGLVSIEIGGGTPVTGTFAGIDWSTGIYFIKTETDPAGGTNYSITGTSQILSVPYSLFAKATDYNNLLNKPAFATVATSGSYNDLNNKPTINGSETKVTAGTNVTVTGTGTTSTPYVINAKTHYIGESYGGGIVFYIYDNGLHGLIAANQDQGTLAPGVGGWYAGMSVQTFATANGLGAGRANTILIIEKQGLPNGYPNYAAKICYEYSVTVDGITYGDWYLPSKFELNLLYLQKSIINCCSIYYTYWSSNEYDNGNAWSQSFNDGSQIYECKCNGWHVRPIRTF